jgi:hypothetical protein
MPGALRVGVQFERGRLSDAHQSRVALGHGDLEHGGREIQYLSELGSRIEMFACRILKIRGDNDP